MYETLVNLEVKVLEKMYLREVENLKLLLLAGPIGNNVLRQADKTLEIAHTIHKKQCGGASLAIEKL